MPAVGELNWPTVAAALGDAVDPTTIQSFPTEPRAQVKDQWCWAAVCEAVAASHGRPLDQAAIVLLCLPGEVDDNRTYYPHLALKKLGAGYAILDATRLREEVPACCTRDEVIITVLLQPNGSATHAVCAFGVATLRGESALVIYDPQPSRKGAAGRDLIKVVPLATMAGGYLEGAVQGARGLWRSAIRVTAFPAVEGHAA